MNTFDIIRDIFAAIGFAVANMFVCAVIVKILCLLFRA